MDPDRFNLDLKTAFDGKDWAGAEKLLAAWRQSRPGDAKGWYLSGFVALKLGHSQRAEESLQKSLSLDPKNASAQKLVDQIRAAKTPKPSRNREADLRAQWKNGQVIQDRYQIKGFKAGGMGVVYFAQDRELDQMVAIKTPLPSALKSEASRARFFREAEAWIGLGIHPNICSAFYVQDMGGIPRLFIEFVSGGSLAEFLANKTKINFKEKLDLAIQIAAGMHHTHTFPWTDNEGREHRGLVHRDLKPANILLDPDGTPRVTDFGLVGTGAAPELEPMLSIENSADQTPDQDGPETPPAAPQNREPGETHWQTMTMAGAAVGTPPYMAPEQWISAHLAGVPADIYAYGCILYDIFCLRRPFRLPKKYRQSMPALQVAQWEKMHRHAPPPRPQEFDPDLDWELAEWMLHCIAKEPQERPQDFKSIQEGLKKVYHRITGWPYPKPETEPFRLIADSRNNQGASYVTLGQVHRAEHAWKQALETDPHHFESMVNLSLSEWKRGALTEEQMFKRIEEVGRTNQEARHSHLLGRLYLFMGAYDRAIRYLEDAVRKNESAAKAFRDLALARSARAGSKKDPQIWKRVASELDKARELNLEDPLLISALALALKCTGREQEALTYYQEAAGRNGSMPSSIEEAISRFLPGHELKTWGRCGNGALGLVAFPSSPYLALADRQGLTFFEPGHPTLKTVTRLDLTPGGIRAIRFGVQKRLALAWVEDSGLALWDLATGKTIRTLNLPPGPEPPILALNPIGTMGLSAGENHGLTVWDPVTGDRIRSLAGHSSPITALAIHPRGPYAISGDREGKMILWNLKTGQKLKTFSKSKEPVGVITFSQDGLQFLTTDRDLYLWVFKTGKCHRHLRALPGRITAAGFTANGGHLVAGSSEGVVHLWETKEGGLEKIFRLEGPITDLVLHPQSNETVILFQTGPDSPLEIGAIETINPDRFRLPFVLTQPMSAGAALEREKEFKDCLGRAKMHLDRGENHDAHENLLKARSIEGFSRTPEALALWDILCCRFQPLSLRAAWEAGELEHSGEKVLALVAEPQTKIILTGGESCFLDVWELGTRNLIHHLEGHNHPIQALALDDSGRTALSADRGGGILRWDLAGPRVIHTLRHPSGEITAAAMSPDGRFALTAGKDRNIAFWNLERGSIIGDLKGHLEPVTALAFSPNGCQAFSGSRDQKVILWFLSRGKDDFKALPGHTGPVTCLAAGPDGRYVASGSEDGTIRIWDALTGYCQWILKSRGTPVTTLGFSPNPRFLVSGNQDATLTLWDLDSGSETRVFEGHLGAVINAVFEPDGQNIVSTAQDLSVKVWHLDWEPEVRGNAMWDDRIRPFLSAFLARQTPYIGEGPQRFGTPQWTEDQFFSLFRTIGRSGFAWLIPGGAREELAGTAASWEQSSEGQKYIKTKSSGSGHSDASSGVVRKIFSIIRGPKPKK